MKAAKFPNVPRGDWHLGFVYAAALSNGLVKVGFSRTPRNRIYMLQSQVRRKFGCTVTGVHVSGPLPAPSSRVMLAEADVLRRLAGIGTPVAGANEFFANVPFGLAVTLVRQITRAHQPQLTQAA